MKFRFFKIKYRYSDIPQGAINEVLVFLIKYRYSDIPQGAINEV